MTIPQIITLVGYSTTLFFIALMIRDNWKEHKAAKKRLREAETRELTPFTKAINELKAEREHPARHQGEDEASQAAASPSPQKPETSGPAKEQA